MHRLCASIRQRFLCTPISATASAAAFLAISARRSELMLLARAAPPFLPSAFAAGSLPSSGYNGTRQSSPVAIRMTWTALPITSAGRFSPLGPLGMGVVSQLE